eukprot:1615488-Prymnesium_polylepis.1
MTACRAGTAPPPLTIARDRSFIVPMAATRTLRRDSLLSVHSPSWQISTCVAIRATARQTPPCVQTKRCQPNKDGS